MPHINFSIIQWQGWASGIHDVTQWQAWAHAPFCPLGQDEIPRLDFLSPMQRRRLDAMARRVFACAWPLAGPHPPVPVVLASRHGEVNRSFELLQTLARSASLSPTSFGLSVHNAILGQWSIIRQETVESVALSVENDGAEHAFLEAGALHNRGYEKVLVILAEECPPKPYRAWTADVPFPYAAAFLLGRGADWTLELSPSPEKSGATEPYLPGALNLLRHLSLGSANWRHHAENRTWLWTRRH